MVENGIGGIDCVSLACIHFKHWDLLKCQHRPFLKPRLRLWILLRLAWPRGCFDNCASFAYTLRASDEGTAPETESKAEAMVSKRAFVSYV